PARSAGPVSAWLDWILSSWKQQRTKKRRKKRTISITTRRKMRRKKKRKKKIGTSLVFWAAALAAIAAQAGQKRPRRALRAGCRQRFSCIGICPSERPGYVDSRSSD